MLQIFFKDVVAAEAWRKRMPRKHYLTDLIPELSVRPKSPICLNSKSFNAAPKKSQLFFFEKMFLLKYEATNQAQQDNTSSPCD